MSSLQPAGNATTMLAGGAILTALAALALLVPMAPCPVCPPDIFTITTSIVVPGGPIADPPPLFCDCWSHGGKVSLLFRWRSR